MVLEHCEKIEKSRCVWQRSVPFLTMDAFRAVPTLIGGWRENPSKVVTTPYTFKFYVFLTIAILIKVEACKVGKSRFFFHSISVRLNTIPRFFTHGGSRLGARNSGSNFVLISTSAEVVFFLLGNVKNDTVPKRLQTSEGNTERRETMRKTPSSPHVWHNGPSILLRCATRAFT